MLAFCGYVPTFRSHHGVDELSDDILHDVHPCDMGKMVTYPHGRNGIWLLLSLPSALRHGAVHPWHIHILSSMVHSRVEVQRSSRNHDHKHQTHEVSSAMSHGYRNAAYYDALNLDGRTIRGEDGRRERLCVYIL